MGNVSNKAREKWYGQAKKKGDDGQAAHTSRKDYQHIAEAINKGASKKEIADNISKYFASDNPRFDVDRFMSACGLREGEKIGKSEEQTEPAKESE